MSNRATPRFDQVAKVRSLIAHLPQDASKRRVGPLCVHGIWRGKVAWLVGYTWTRQVGEPKPSQIKEEVLGHAADLAEAIGMMEIKLESMIRSQES